MNAIIVYGKQLPEELPEEHMLVSETMRLLRFGSLLACLTRELFECLRVNMGLRC